MLYLLTTSRGTRLFKSSGLQFACLVGLQACSEGLQPGCDGLHLLAMASNLEWFVVACHRPTSDGHPTCLRWLPAYKRWPPTSSVYPGFLGFLLRLACGTPQSCQYAISRVCVCVLCYVVLIYLFLEGLGSAGQVRWWLRHVLANAFRVFLEQHLKGGRSRTQES